MLVDVHQHLWTEPLLAALEERRELPFVRREGGLAVLFAAGERPYVIDSGAQAAEQRAAQLQRDGLEEAYVCLSSPLGIESLPRTQSQPLIDAYHEGALSLGHPFGVWSAIALDGVDPADAELAHERGCVGTSLPAGALAGAGAIARLEPLLARLEAIGAPLFVHPGPGVERIPVSAEQASLCEPLWWPALTRYVAQMQSAWLAFASSGRSRHPELRVIFAMLGGLAPLHAERLRARGGPSLQLRDSLTFYDISSYGRSAIGAIAAVVGWEQLLYGSDRPVVEPTELHAHELLDAEHIAESTKRALGALAVTAP